MSKKILALSMIAYIGTKSLSAVVLTRGEYNDYRGWEIPSDEDPSEQGYLVEYADGGKPNDERHKGYISWSPACVFKDAYRPNGSLTFGDALTALKLGKKVARSGWNDLQYVVAQAQSTNTEASKIWNPHNKAHAEKLGGNIDVAPYCTLKTVQDTLAMGWTPSTGDLFAEDWLVINNPL